MQLVLSTVLVGRSVRRPLVTAKSQAAGGAQPPSGHVHVSRATGTGVAVLLADTAPALVSGTARRPMGKKPRLLQLRVQPVGICGMGNHVAKKVVPTGAVARATTNQHMVALAVQHSIAKRALGVAVSRGDAKPAPKHANEESRIVVKLGCPGRRGVQIHAGPFSANKVKVRSPRPAATLAELSERTLVHCFRKLLLRELFGTKLLQFVVVAESLVESARGNTFRGEAGIRRLNGMVWVQLLAKVNTAAARSKESTMAVLTEGPQPKTPQACAKGGLHPLAIVRVQTEKLFKASPDLVIKPGDSSRVEAGRHSPDGGDHFAESRTAAEELKSDLGVVELTQGLQGATCLVHTLLSVRVAILRGPTRSPRSSKFPSCTTLKSEGKR